MLWPSKAPKQCYGQLALGDASVKFWIPAASAPREGSGVMISGALRLNKQWMLELSVIWTQLGSRQRLPLCGEKPA